MLFWSIFIRKRFQENSVGVKSGNQTGQNLVFFVLKTLFSQIYFSQIYYDEITIPGPSSAFHCLHFMQIEFFFISKPRVIT